MISQVARILRLAAVLLALLTWPTASLGQSGLVITEIMDDPLVADADGEWFELFNLGTEAVDLNGWSIRSGSGSHTITSGPPGTTTIAGGGFLVLGASSDTSLNGGTPVDYVYGSDITLAGDGDLRLVEADGTTIHNSVDWDSSPPWPENPEGSSMTLSGPVDNSVGANWCTSASAYGGGTQRGSPSSHGRCALSGIVITEIMDDPLGADADGEWFEVFNLGTEAVDLNGWTIRSGSDSHTIGSGVSDTTTIAGNWWLVLGASTNPALNGNTLVSYAYGSDITLAGDGDLSLLEPGGTIHDSVDWDSSAPWPENPEGSSMTLTETLQPRVVASLDNSLGPNWCTSGGTYLNSEQRGSPEAAGTCEGGVLPGSVEITEIMDDPLGPDADGEWFEVQNYQTTAVDLDGWSILSGDTWYHTIRSGSVGTTVIRGNSYLILGASRDLTVNGNTPVDYVYGADIALSGDGDLSLLEPGGTIHDSVDWDSSAPWPENPEGSSMALTGLFVDNNHGGNWCESSHAYSGSAQRGSPGFGGGCAAGDIVINEIFSLPSPQSLATRRTGGWVELHNRGSSPVSLIGWEFEIDSVRVAIEAGAQLAGGHTGTIAAGDYMVFGSYRDSGRNGGVTVDFEFPDAVDFGTVSRLTLTSAGVIEDSVPVVGVHEGASVQLRAPELDNNVDLNWCLSAVRWGPRGDHGTPGRANDCPDSSAVPGQIVITEVMYDPEQVADADGQWFELVNTGETPVDLDGWTVRSGASSHVLRARPSDSRIRTVFPKLSVFVIGRKCTENGYARVHYCFDGRDDLALSADGDLALIDADGTVHDAVDWQAGTGDWPAALAGVSIALSSVYVDNDAGANWCSSPQEWYPFTESGLPPKGVNTDRGSPSRINSCPTPAEPGQVVITEIMYNPDRVAAADGQWFELNNRSDVSYVDLTGWTIRSGASASLHVLVDPVDGAAGSVLIPPTPNPDVVEFLGAHERAPFLVIGRCSGNGDVPVDYCLNGVDDIDLSANGSLELIKPDGTIHDAVVWESGRNDWPEDIAGASIALRAVGLDISQGINWCISPAAWAAGSDRGSPGAGNDCRYDVVLNEVFYWPAGADTPSLGDGRRLWVELHNAGPYPERVLGSWIGIRSSNTVAAIHRLRRDNLVGGHTGTIPAGGYMVLGTDADPARNGDVNVDYRTDLLADLGTQSLFALISVDSVVQEEVDYGSFGAERGASLQLRATDLDNSAENNSAENWCIAQRPWGSDEGRGTPGAATDCTSFREPAPGQVLVNEIFRQPSVGSGVLPERAEWFELHNAGSFDVDIESWIVAVSPGSGEPRRVTLSSGGGTTVIQGGGYLVLAASADSSQNGGVTAHYELGDSIMIRNGATLTLNDDDGTEHDRVDFDRMPFEAGASIQLRAGAAANNDPANWCKAERAWGPASNVDRGTPGAANACNRTAVHAGDQALTVVWDPPAGVAGIVGYDLRYISASADPSADANWTVVDDVWTLGRLQYVLTGLTNGVAYNVQFRAVTNTEQPWSPSLTGTPAEPGNTSAAGLELPFGVALAGNLQAGDTDWFTLSVEDSSDILIFTRGEVDTAGRVVASDGRLVAEADDSGVPGEERAFVIVDRLDAGTYHVEVSGRQTGPYRIEAVQESVAERELSSDGTVAVSGGGEIDSFKFTLPREMTVVIRSPSGSGFVRGVLARASDEVLVAVASGRIFGGSYGGFIIVDTLPAGKYIVDVDFSSGSGPYRLEVEEMANPGGSLAEALDVETDEVGAGWVEGGRTVHFFRFTLAEAGIFRGYLVSRSADIEAALLDSLGDSVAAGIWNRSLGGFRSLSALRARLAAGTYYLRVRAVLGTVEGAYHFLFSRHEAAEALETECAALDSPFSDPLAGCQWHLRNVGQTGGTTGEDMRVEDVAAGARLGAGVTVAVVDDGLDELHPDLRDNVDESLGWDYSESRDLLNYGSSHGTSVAGVIAAAANDEGGRGVAPRATVYGANFLARGTLANSVAAMTRHQEVTAVSNNSWGPGDRPSLSSAASIWEMAVRSGTELGHGGNGVVYVFAAGNGHRDGDYSNLDELANFYAVTAVCAVNHDGVRSSYSEMGANLWVCAPSNDGREDTPGIMTTANYGSYTKRFGGTSSAAPAVAGVAALLRARTPDLTWRDVKLILAGSARKNDGSDTGWETGALKYGSSGRYEFNHEYGFGVVNASAAVERADGWPLVPPMLETVPLETVSKKAIPDGRARSSTVDVGSDLEFIEFVEVNARFRAQSFRDLRVELVSPSGAVSELSVPFDDGKSYPLTTEFRFGSARHLGEDPRGVWRLRVTDEVAGRGANTLDSWSLKFYGHRQSPTPSSPMIGSIGSGLTELAVTWSRPLDSGASEVTRYDLRYTQRSTGDWTVHEGVRSSADPGTPLRWQLRGLVAGTSYGIQVRAENASGKGPWSATRWAVTHVLYGGDGDGDDGDGGDGDGDGDDDGPLKAVIAVNAVCADGLCHARTGEPLIFEDVSTGAIRSRRWDFGDGGSSGGSPAHHAWSEPGFYDASLTVSDGVEESTATQVFLVTASDPAGTCEADAGTLCAQDSRFAVSVEWWTKDGERGEGTVVRSGTNDSGLYWFFSRNNWEVLIKVLDGCGINGHYWVFGASTTDVGYRIAVTDTVTGEVREYGNEPGLPAAAITDTSAFAAACGERAAQLAAASEWPAADGGIGGAHPGWLSARQEDGCTESSTSLCVQDGRYAVTVDWSTIGGESGAGRVASARSVDSGVFYFFDPGNWEMLVKVLDGCSLNGHHWVFAASATDLGLDLTVRDTETGALRQYTRTPGKPAPALLDLAAFPGNCTR